MIHGTLECDKRQLPVSVYIHKARHTMAVRGGDSHTAVNVLRADPENRQTENKGGGAVLNSYERAVNP